MKNTASGNNFSSYVLLILRLTLVAIFLDHGLPKAIFWSMATEKFIGFGLPGFLGPITGIAAVIPSLFSIFIVLLVDLIVNKIKHYIYCI